MTGERTLEGGGPERGAIYRRLGVEPIVNGRSTFTVLGGSLMPPVVLEAMRQAADSFVDLFELQEAVGRRLAALTRNEAAFVTAGAAAGLFLSAAACMVRRTEDGILRLGELEGLPREFVIHRAHRIPEDAAIQLAGGRLVEIGGESGTTVDELEAVLGSSTAAIVYVPRAYLADRVLSLDVIVALARSRGIPLVVDAAAQLPPAENLWRYSEAGADLVIFSGGKALCGPASAGLIVGGRDFVDLVTRNAAPHERSGRSMKVSKEEMVGLLAAVEWYLEQDQSALGQRYEGMVEHLVTWGRGRSDVEVSREALGEAGQPTPRAWIRLPGRSAAARDELLAALRASPPRIDLLPDAENGFYVAPETLLPGEEATISRRLEELLAIERA